MKHPVLVDVNCGEMNGEETHGGFTRQMATGENAHWEHCHITRKLKVIRQHSGDSGIADEELTVISLYSLNLDSEDGMSEEEMFMDFYDDPNK